MMKYLLTVLMIAMLTLPALAENQMGVSALDDALDPVKIIDINVPFSMHVVLVDPTQPTIGGYECSLSFDGDQPVVLEVGGPNGWTNFGAGDNHLVGYGTPLPATPYLILATYSCLVLEGPFETYMVMGPSEPSSFDGEGPGYVDGENTDLLVLCTYTLDDDGVVGAISDEEVVPVETKSLSAVKTLFE